MATHYQVSTTAKSVFFLFFFDLFDSCGFENEDINCQYSLNDIDRPCVQISSLDSSRVLKYLRKSPGLEICRSRLLWGLFSRWEPSILFKILRKMLGKQISSFDSSWILRNVPKTMNHLMENGPLFMWLWAVCFSF